MELADKIVRSGQVVDLGRDEYDVHGFVVINDGRIVTGNGAVIHHYPDADWDPCVVVRGAGVRLEGDVRVVGTMPDGSPYNDNREGNHGIAVQSAKDAFIGPWMITNFWGDGIYAAKRPKRDLGWSENLTLDGTRFDECGRCSLTFQALVGGHARNLNIQRSNMSVCDMEPNGADWGCKSFTWKDSLVRDHGGGFVLASIGAGRTDAVCDIVLDGIRCPNRIFNVNIRPPEGTTRSNFILRNCSGGEVATSTPLRFTRVDGILIENVRQPCADHVPLCLLNDCRHWKVPGSASPNPKPGFPYPTPEPE